MDKEKELPKRKNLRIKQYDYSSSGAYFVTICVKERKRILSDIVKPVGVGALDDPFYPQVHLTEIGKIVEKNLLSSKKISGVMIDRYVIMPDAPTPTNEMLPHVIYTFKRFCNKEIGENIFQRGYIEHIIRDKEDYETRVKYIYENPMRWYYDELYTEE